MLSCILNMLNCTVLSVEIRFAFKVSRFTSLVRIRSRKFMFI